MICACRGWNRPGGWIHTNMNRVTVVLLTYNHEKTLARAIDSILEQKTAFDFEIHVLEDCSTDGTAEVCRAYQDRYPDRIRVFRNDRNVGPTRNFKQGIARVVSPYFAFLEGDDYWTDPGKLQIQIDAMERNPDCTLCAHNTEIRNVPTGETRLFVPADSRKNTGTYELADRFPIHTSSTVYRNCVDLTNIPEPLLIDTYLFFLYLTKGNMFYVDRTMSVYNETGTGYWTGKNQKRKRMMFLQLQKEANRFYDFKYESLYYTHSTLLRILKGILGIRYGWEAFYHLESLRLRAKYFLLDARPERSDSS